MKVKYRWKKMKKSEIIGFVLIICLVLLSYNTFKDYLFKEPKVEKVDTVLTTKTDTIWRDTTITKKEFVPKIIEKVRTDTVFSKDGDTIQLVTENKVYQDTIICKKDTAELQIFTSGIRSNVDSINLRLKKSEITKTNTVTITKYIEKKKTIWDRFHISAQGGMGYGFFYKGVEPYIGVGGSFDL